MKYDFHGVTVECTSSDSGISRRWSASFASRPVAEGPSQVRFTLHRADSVPPAPEGEPDFQQGDLLQYHVRGADVVAHFPRYGQLSLNLNTGQVEGRIVAAALATYGVFEDLVAIGLSPLLRRRGMFLLHAFAASPPERLRVARSGAKGTHPRRGGVGAVLLVGDIGAGKTTTGLSLLHAGWKLLSNDSPVLKDEGEIQVLAYPGLLSAYPDSLLRFPELHGLATMDHAPSAGRRKVIFAAEDYFPAPWIDRAPAGALIFPQIEARHDHALEPLPAPEALRLLLPNAVEQWDREMIPAHLALLTKLAKTTPAFRLRLGPDTDSVPDVIASALAWSPNEKTEL